MLAHLADTIVCSQTRSKYMPQFKVKVTRRNTETGELTVEADDADAACTVACTQAENATNAVEGAPTIAWELESSEFEVEEDPEEVEPEGDAA
jgi:hypothetical protein